MCMLCFTKIWVCFPKNVLGDCHTAEPGARRSRGRSSGAGLLVELPTPPCAAWRAAAKAEAAAASDGSRDGRRGGRGLVQ